MDDPETVDAREARLREALARRLGSLVVVCETVRRRHNVSAILRSCEAFGVHEVHLVTGGFSRPSRGAARGAERWVERRTFPTLDESVAELRARGFRIVIADLRPGAWSPEEVPVDAPVALVMGSELLGVSDRARELADGAVCIPMHGLTGSLNVSASAAILVRTLGERRRAVRGADLAPDAQAACLSRWLARDAAALAGRAARVAPVHPEDPGAALLAED
jgi:tRNA (guanosine-2'-O-)-methyltransferase